MLGSLPLLFSIQNCLDPLLPMSTTAEGQTMSPGSLVLDPCIPLTWGKGWASCLLSLVSGFRFPPCLRASHLPRE